MALNLGDKAPNFTLPQNGGGQITLSALQGQKVVLFFYPKANTSGCTVEAKEFSSLEPEFAAKNTRIFGVSKDPVKDLDKFVTKAELTVDLITDESTDILNAYGVYKEKSMYGKTYMGIERTTFLIDETGKIAKIWEKVKPEGHAEDVLNSI